MYRVDWDTDTLLLPVSQTNYIYVTSAGMLTSNTSLPNIISNVYLGRVITNGTTITIIDAVPMYSNSIANNNFSYLLNGVGPVYSSGSSTTENVTPRHLDITSGFYYVATIPFMPSGGTNITFTQYNKNGSSTFVTSLTNIVNNTQYNNSNTLSSLTASYYAQHSLYVVGEGLNEQYMLVLAQAEYSSLIAAETTTIPIPPSFFNGSISLIAGIIVQQGSANIIEILDQRPVVGFRATGTTTTSDHQSLSNRDALDAHSQYLLKGNADSMGINLNMGTFNIYNVEHISDTTNSGQTMIPTAHGSRHLPNGQDALTTAAPISNLSNSSINSIGTANSFARSDHSHFITTSSINMINDIVSRDLNGSSSFSKLFLNDTINQIIFGTGIVSTLIVTTPSVNSVITVPNTNGDSRVIMSRTLLSNQNINGALHIEGTGTLTQGFTTTGYTYLTGTASQTTTIVTGVGTTFTSDMIGGLIKFLDGSQSFITGFTDTLHLTVTPSQSIVQQTYIIYYGGLQTTGDNTNINMLYSRTGLINSIISNSGLFGGIITTSSKSSISNIGTGLISKIISDNIISTTGIFTDIVSSGVTTSNISNISTANIISLISSSSYSGTGSFNGVLISNGTVSSSTGIFTNIISTGIFTSNTSNIANANITNLTLGGNITTANVLADRIVANTGIITNIISTGITTSMTSIIATGLISNIISGQISCGTATISGKLTAGSGVFTGGIMANNIGLTTSITASSGIFDEIISGKSTFDTTNINTVVTAPSGLFTTVISNRTNANISNITNLISTGISSFMNVSNRNRINI